MIIADVKEGAIGEDCGGWKRGAGWLRSCGKEFNGKVWHRAARRRYRAGQGWIEDKRLGGSGERHFISRDLFDHFGPILGHFVIQGSF